MQTEQLPAQWGSTQLLVSPPPASQLRCAPSLVTALALFLAFLILCSALSVWATMFSLNNEGFNSMSSQIQRTQVNSTFLQVILFVKSSIQACQVVSERLRIGAQTIGVNNSILNLPFVLNTTMFVARQFAQGVYVGYPHLELMMGSSGWVNAFGMMNIGAFLSPANESVLYTYATDPLGNIAGPPLSSVPYVVTQRPWMITALKARTATLTNAYVFASSQSVGISIVVPLFEDLQPPVFFPDSVPYAPPNGPQGQPRRIIGVVSQDMLLDQLSALLKVVTLNQNGQGQLWLFTNRGIVLATSETSTPLALNGSTVHVSQVDNPLFNATMSYILQNSPGQDYRNLTVFINRYLNFFNVEQIVTLDVLPLPGASTSNEEKDILVYLVIITPKLYYFQAAVTANIVALLVLFVVILPFTSIVGACIAQRFCSRPIRAMSVRLGALATFSDVSVDEADRESHSVFREIRQIQLSYEKLRRALLGFARFAPVHIVRSLLSLERPAALGVEETVATAFFSDIVGFTTISEKTPPNELISVLAEYFNAVTDIISARQGLVGDFIGDAVFAFWNTPSRVARHAYMACDAAMAQQEALEELRGVWARRGLPPLRIRIGIHTGSVLAGNVGSDTRMKYTLMGDTVNLASRLEGLGKHYGVELVVSMDTYDEPSVREMFVSRVLDVVAVVGRAQPTTILTLVARRDRASAAQLRVERLSVVAMDHYKARRFDDALDVLEQMDTLQPGHASTRALVERVRLLRVTGVPDEWDGVVKATSK